MPGITNPAEAYFKDGIWGWDGSVWRKLPLVWGFSEIYSEYAIGTAVAAGNAIATTVAVLPGYVHVVKAVAFQHNAVAAKRCMVDVYNAIWVPLVDVAEAAPDVYHCYPNLDIVLEEGDTMDVVVMAAGDGKDVYFRLRGYKMKIAE